MIIGITGGIGSGKSTIARALAARGFAVYDCDREAKRIIAENKEVQEKIIALFGEEAFVKGTYNTSYIAQKVFAQKELLEQLNKIVHPAVKADILSLLPSMGKSEGISRSEEAFLLVESAILYEAGLDKICDKIIVVEAPEEVRIARTLARDYHGEASEENINKVRARIHAQEREQQPHSNVPTTVVQNDGKTSIEEIVEKLTVWM